MKITILGSGASAGVPLVGNRWGACDPQNTKNRRLRPSIWIKEGDFSLVIDTGPDFHQQALTAGIEHINAVLYTHTHADHVHGIDDLRGFNFIMNQSIPIYGSTSSIESIKLNFNYIFKEADGEYDNKPRLVANTISGNFTLGPMQIEPIAVVHGQMETFGYKINNTAYVPDIYDFKEGEKSKLRGLDVLIIDALRIKPHKTHAHLEKTLGWIEELKPKRAYLTHMTIDMDYDTLCRELPPHIRPCYDGLIIDA